MGQASVLIVNWSTPDDLNRCLSSLRAHEGDVEVLVFQNRHSEGIDESSIQVSHNYEAATYWSHENVGHGRGINRLANKSDAEFFFIVNPDVMWTESVIDRLVGFLEEDTNRCMVGPKQMDSQHRITAGGIFGTMEAPLHRMWREPDPGNVHARDTQECIVVAGSALMIRAHDFRAFGGMLEAHHYYSETWLCYHALAHGRTNWYYGEPWMIHEWHRSSAVGSPISDGMFRTDQEIFRLKCDEHIPPIPHD